MPIGLLLVVGGLLFVYSGTKCVNPWDEVKAGLGLAPPPTGQCADPTVGMSAGAAIGVGGTAATDSGSIKNAGKVVIPGPRGSWCNKKVPLATRAGVTLQPAALQGFLCAQQKYGHHIPVGQSTRDCKTQCNDCQSICGNCQGGCPGRCASPGSSYHQIGLAVDVQGVNAQIINAMLACGWHHPLPTSDAGHFSYGPANG
jgi:hypothetical protein